ncbi:TraR/DksA C4-type zinc finger protein [Virgibacillus flavescens]|uniref:TraR/DksA C4-type zinc finger protein n=1 Tax=Virgibacillus flavescens TaxID=1611422 RepID=UPI003D334FD2
MLSSDQVSFFKNQLVKRQMELFDQMESEGEYSRRNQELSNYDNHPADMGTELFDQHRDQALSQHVEVELKEINEALSSIEEGTYGICRTCGIDIPMERMQAIPTADQCVLHAGRAGFVAYRPVEEDVLTPDIHQHTNETQTGYDREDALQEVGRYGSSDTPSDLGGNHDYDNYDEMYINSDENIGIVDDTEGIGTAEFDGHPTE